ncbi:MAG TPA: FG-GAP-like repeat-containing protein, partial [Gemmatimonadales bacterium]|nr:FG-GAP-like repeat-containing protein [Gemmatimonadales bacterium]
DLDGDGDLDVVINRLGLPAAVLRNNATAPRVAVRLVGEPPNTAGIGSRVRLRNGAVPLQQREMTAGGLYLSSPEAMLSFAAGAATDLTIEVLWRDGRRSEVSPAVPNRLYEIDHRGASGPTSLPGEGPAAASRGPAPATPHGPLFQDVTDHLGGHRHVEPYFDDYTRQLLLPNAFSQLGPGVAWQDVDGDGREDLVVGAGRGGRMAWFRNDGRRLRAAPTVVPVAPGDLTAVLGWPLGDGRRRVIAGVSSYELGTTAEALQSPSIVAYDLLTGSVTALAPGDTASMGPLAAADYDGDGDLDLFAGARILPGAYPLSPSSRFWRNDRGALVRDSVNNQLVAAMGMVSAASFADLNGDGWPDLLVAIEWGTIRVLWNRQGRFSSAGDLPGLSGRYSRWNGLATGDLDGDGGLDIVATSWGRNTDHQADEARPLLLYAGFFAEPRRPGILLAQYDPRIGAVAPLGSYARLSLAIPGMADRVRSFAVFAEATVDQVLGAAAAGAVRLGATTLDHTVFLNRGERFEGRPLPDEAQAAPGFHVSVADFNGDGHEDVFVSQNFFATDVSTARYDAGRSLLLSGDGAGDLTPVVGQESGLLVYGEQRGAAHADFDGDGRVDLAVTQNGAATRLFRNVGARPGLRVSLIGPAGNPNGVGAHLRLRYAASQGPVREVQAGSGYWSQNGAVQVLGLAGEPTALWVRWPGGREQIVPLTEGQRVVSVRAP